MMINKSLLVLVLAAVSLAEPPVDYSTTQQDAFAPPAPNAPSASYGVPSNSYGPPSSGRFSGGNRQTTAILRPSSNYGAPPSAAYGPPSSIGGSRGSATFGGTGFGGRGSFRRPSTSYGTPSSGFGGSSSGFGGGSSSFSGGSSSFGGSSGGFGGSSGGFGGSSGGFGGYPARGSGGYDDGSSGPASYKFSYHVQDAASGNDYGHQESREGHVATGMYMVLLPDGRRQIVEYTADETGYHPNVRYEGTAIGATGGGYPGTSASGGGYRY